MKLIVGLGNPGRKYEFTRHNAGFMAIDYFALCHDASFSAETRLKCELARVTIGSETVLLTKPTTFMNLSGESLIAVMNFYKIEKQDVIIVYDDIALNLGAMRFRNSGSDGGHNGIKSIIKVLGSDKFDRLKIGIGPQPGYMPSESYVLQDFRDEELPELKETIKLCTKALECYLESGVQAAQNSFNKK